MSEIVPGFDHWRKSGAYLPEFMRGFHDQKDLFKALDEIRERSIAKNGGTYMRDVSWIDAQVYTVDIFLWVMAGHGYTLQRSRRRFAFGDVVEFAKSAKRRWDEAAANALGLTPLTQPPTGSGEESGT